MCEAHRTWWSNDDIHHFPIFLVENTRSEVSMIANWLLTVILILTLLQLALASSSGSSANGGDSLDAQAQTIVDGLSTDQVIGQMCQFDISMVLNDDNSVNETLVRRYAKLGVGSYLNSPFAGWNATGWRNTIKEIQTYHMDENGGHPMVYGLDSVHGAQYVDQAVLFPQQINAGASFNPDLTRKMGYVTGRDTAAAGITWVLGPILDISYNPLWTRTYETFGEDPYLVSVLGAAYIQGVQNNSHSGACMKHFIGYAQTTTGVDREGVTISDYDLLNYHVPSFKAGIEYGAMSTMENYVSINGVPVVSSTKILNNLLRDDLGFDGVVVTDWGEVNNLQSWHRVVSTQQAAVELVIANASLDMSMVPYSTDFIDQVKYVLTNNPDYESRLRSSAMRIVKMKLEMGLYDTPVPGEDNVDLVGNDDDLEEALNLARESIVLLKNDDNILPLANGTSVFLTGFSVDDIGYQCGGWSIYWQGTSGNEYFAHGTSVRQGIENLVGTDSVTYFNGLSVDGTYSDEDLSTATGYASSADVVIVAIGEAPYAEKWGDIDELTLPSGQLEYVQALANTGTKVVLILFEGRPRLLGSLPDSVSAVVWGGLPCEQGGQAMAEILFGEVNPSGRLPITYPKQSGHIMIPYRHRVDTQCTYGACEMQWDFGAGLSYTNFSYSDLKLSTNKITSNKDTVTASVKVTNNGTMTGKETVMLFMIQPYRVISVPEVKMLRKFEKIELEAGSSTTVMFTLTADDWSVYKPQIGSDFNQVAENGEFVVAIHPDTDCDVYNDAGITNELCANFTLAATSATVGDSTSSTASMTEMAWWATILIVVVGLTL
ncbi:Lysosomal beta glucosidase [Phytophthora fragariae]|uniref:beta-glucosidase n=1 Tax=Phytophthora fragariae TaxID=53985 RepID=A0A6G0QUJ8_9STRA|nr:Lysosomal beta glucosidase [Phytophthora fragariae]